MHQELAETVFAANGGLNLHLPDAVANRYHLTEGVEVQVVQVEEGILLRPLGVAPWFSIEWEQALDDVIEYYGPVLEQVGE